MSILLYESEILTTTEEKKIENRIQGTEMNYVKRNYKGR